MAVQLVESLRVGRKAKLRIVCLIGVAETEADLVAVEAKSRAWRRGRARPTAQRGSGRPTGTGKTDLAVGLGRACIRDGHRGRFFNVVDLVNRFDRRPTAALHQVPKEVLGHYWMLIDNCGQRSFKAVSEQCCSRKGVSPQYAVTWMIAVLESLKAFQSGHCFAWDGSSIEP